MKHLRQTLIISGGTLFSRVLGLVRDVLMGRLLGVGGMADIAFVVLLLPNVFRRLMAEGVFNAAFVPIAQGLDDHSRPHFMNAVAGWLFICLTVIIVLSEIFMSQLVGLLAPGFSTADHHLTVQFGRISMVYLFCIVAAAWAGSVLAVHKKFSAFAMMPSLLNLSLIGMMLSPWATVFPLPALVTGLVVGGVLQWGFMMLALNRSGVHPFLPTTQWRHPELITFGKRLLPALLGVGVLQISVLIDTICASFLESGSLSALQYATRCYQLPLAFLATAAKQSSTPPK